MITAIAPAIAAKNEGWVARSTLELFFSCAFDLDVLSEISKRKVQTPCILAHANKADEEIVKDARMLSERISERVPSLETRNHLSQDPFECWVR